MAKHVSSARNRARSAAAAAAILALAGCAVERDAGTAARPPGAGGLSGALVSAQFPEFLQLADRRVADQTAQRALETLASGDTARWSNAQQTVLLEVTPEPAYRDAAERICREFAQTIVSGQRSETARGAACRAPDGVWRAAAR